MSKLRLAEPLELENSRAKGTGGAGGVLQPLQPCTNLAQELVQRREPRRVRALVILPAPSVGLGKLQAVPNAAVHPCSLQGTARVNGPKLPAECQLAPPGSNPGPVAHQLLTLDQPCNLSKPQFPHLQCGNNDTSFGVVSKFRQENIGTLPSGVPGSE